MGEMKSLNHPDAETQRRQRQRTREGKNKNRQEGPIGFAFLIPLLFSAFLFSVPLCLCGSSSSPPPAQVVRLTRDGGFKQHLQWSPDGKRFLFTRIHKGKMGLWTMNADGGGLHPLLNPDPNTPHFDGCWSPDCKKIAFVLDVLQGTDGKLQINTCSADGAGSKVLIPNTAFEESPRWSPDGKRLAWVSTRHGNQEIYSARADGSDVKRLTNDAAMDNNPAWSPDGKKIAFATRGRGTSRFM